MIILSTILQIINLLASVSIAYSMVVFFKAANDSKESAIGSARPTLKPWTKKEKRKPKANDDTAAWKKENNIE